MSSSDASDRILAAAGAEFMAGPAEVFRLHRNQAPANAPFRLLDDPDDSQGLILKRAEWNKATPFRVDTARLIMSPVRARDLTAFHRIAGQASIARMLVNLEHPLSLSAAENWLAKSRFRGRLGFMVGIYDRQGNLLGAIGLGGLSTSLVYFLNEEVRGQGIASEAVHGFLGYAVARFNLNTVFAGVFTDNPASRHILQKENFAVTGTKPFRSPARTAPAAIWEMEWSRTQWSRND